MRNKALAIYLVILIVLCTSVIAGAKMLGKQGAYLAQGYMLTPAIAAILTRLFFYKPRFSDANLRFGTVKGYVKFWAISLAITGLSFILFTALGAIKWDLSGQAFLTRLTQQLAGAGQDVNASLPSGFTPHMMLIVFFIGGLTVFNIVPGVITGFGEEFGHRGFMFPLLYQVNPWSGFIIGGLIWFAWHLPLVFVIPQTAHHPLWLSSLNYVILAVGSVCTFTYLAYVYVKTRSVWITSVAHVAMNNSAASLSYFVVIKNQTLANLGLVLTMIIILVVLYYRKQLGAFAEYFSGRDAGH